jgi:hypothetical protein
MRRPLLAAFVAATTLALLACQRTGSSDAARPAATNAAPKLHLDHAQPRLPTLKLWLGAKELEAEIARRTQEIATGMMFRTNVAETEGMLFVFGRPHRPAFYMRNTRVPLTAAYLAPDGTILELHDLKPLDETPVPAASDNVMFVLEVAQGWFHRHGVSTGAVVRTSQGALLEIDWATLRPRVR